MRPATETAAQGYPASNRAERSDPSAHSSPIARLLIVDDEKAQVSALCCTLTSEGFATTGVGSAAEALYTLRSAASEHVGAFDVLITDLTMPDMDGIALLRAAQKIDPDLVGLVMTGHATLDTAVKAMKSGALDYIAKPFNLSVILPVLTRALIMRNLRIENTKLLYHLAKRTTELEVANRDLKSANRELEAFSSSVSHDVRQPLSGMISFSEFLLSEESGPLNAQQKEFLGYIYRSGRQLVCLTDDLLAFSHLGHQTLRKETVSIEKLVSQILRQLRDAEPSRSVELRVSALPEAEADPSLLRQVFVNLLSNAFKFTRRVPHPVIEVTGRQQTNECVYVVSDNGAGFDMAASQRLFAIFHRLHSSQDFEGTGVGLSIAHRVIERHGGRIWAEAAVGKGAKFTFTLPV